MAVLALPPGAGDVPSSALCTDSLQSELLERWRIQVPVIPCPAPPARLVRISAQVYNRCEEYQLLADPLQALLGEEAASPLPRPAPT